MSTELKTQIRHLASGAEAGQRPVTVDEVLARLESRDDTDPVVRPAERPPLLSRGPWPALVAAAVVLVIFGVFAWVFPNDETPPADTLPDPVERELGNYVTTAVPEGFVLQEVNAQAFIGGSSVLYLRDGTTWLPSDGGFQLEDPFGSPVRLPEDPVQYLDQIRDAFPRSEEVEVDGRTGVILETPYVDGPVTTDLISLLVIDEEGGVYEITAVGMSREEVMSVAAGVDRVPAADYAAFGAALDWDLVIDIQHDSFQHEVPAPVLEVATDMKVALGVDLFFRPRLAMGEAESEEMTVVTTDDGSIVETEPTPVESQSGHLYVSVAEGAAFEARASLEGEEIYPELSPALQSQATVDYLDRISDGNALSEDPYVLQASRGPEPQFDLSDFGREIPFVPVSDMGLIPDSVFSGGLGGGAAPATVELPLVTIGTASQPGADDPGVTVMVWATEMGALCVGSADGPGIAYGCGSLPLDRFGPTGSSLSDNGDGYLEYEVPLETSVVQVFTDEGSFWQRPIAGLGLLPFGETVGMPTSLTAFDAQGNELGQWEVDLD